MNQKASLKNIAVTALIAVLIAVPVLAANQATGTFTWFVAEAYSISVSANGGCSFGADASGIFFFPEADAALDSDTDGNCLLLIK